MSSRPSKRRKLDGDGDGDGDGDAEPTSKSSPAPATRAKASMPANGLESAKAKSSSAVAASLQPDAHQAWFEAKRMKTAETQKVRKEAKQAKGLARSQAKKDELSLYDDFEGAHNVAPLYVQRGVSGSSPAPVNGSTKRKIGIFEQFARKPSPQSESHGRAGKVNGSNGRLGSISARQGRLKQREDTPEELEGEDEDGDEEEELTPKPSRPSAESNRRVSQGKGWITATEPPKKTFEDEIRELEAKAGGQVMEDSEDELADEGRSQKPAVRRPARREAAIKREAKPQPASGAKRKAPKPLDRRRAVREEASDDVLEVPESDPEDRMDADDLCPQALSPSRNGPKSDMSTPRKSAPLARSDKLSAKTGIAIEFAHLRCLQSIVLEKAAGRRHIPLTNLQDEYTKVHTIINQTITAGESNSMLLIGARGSAKTALINQIIREQQRLHADDFHVVRLNGFIHTDDKIALREIWRQLGREMHLDEEEGMSKNYADTMTRLLALLSHPAEMGLETDQVTKSVIFILDEFELFASHPRQTLLYNLFDIAQSRKAPIAVFGLTTRINVAESLEKRVKSRFSHRYVHLGMSKSLQAFEQVCKSAMQVQLDELSVSEKAQLGDVDATLAAWNTAMENARSSDACAPVTRRIYHTTKSVSEFLIALAFGIATLPSTAQTTSTIFQLLTKSFESGLPLHPPDSKLSLLSSLSTLQLALLICAARLANIYNTEIISFALTYEEYKVLASKAKLQASASGAIGQSRVWGKDVAKGAWEELVQIGFIMEDGRAGGTGRVDVGLEEIGMSSTDLGGWGKWCKEI